MQAGNGAQDGPKRRLFSHQDVGQKQPRQQPRALIKVPVSHGRFPDADARTILTTSDARCPCPLLHITKHTHEAKYHHLANAS